MLLWENVVLAVNSLLSNKMRALLTMLGIIIGIGAVIAIITVGDSLTLSVSESMQSIGANNIYIVVEGKTEEDSKNIEDEENEKKGINYGKLSSSGQIESKDYITNDMIKEMTSKFQDEIYAVVAEYTLGSGIASRGGNKASINTRAINAGFFITNEINLKSGAMFSQNDFEERKNVALVSDRLVNKLFDGDIEKAIGSEIPIETQDGGVGNVTIIGVYEYQENYMMGMSLGSGDDVKTDLYIPLGSAKNFVHGEINYPYIQVIANVGTDVQTLITKLKNFYEPYYAKNQNCKISAFSMETMVSKLTELLETITLAISIVAGIALIVGGIGVMNIMLVSVTERTKEIGTRKALGAKNSSIRTQFIVEAMIICLIGGAIGVVFGIISGIFASNLLGYPAKPSIFGIIVSLVFSMTIGVFFGYYPANKAAKMNPIDALRYE